LRLFPQGTGVAAALSAQILRDGRSSGVALSAFGPHFERTPRLRTVFD